MLKAQGKKRLSLTDDQRRLLAVKGKCLGRKVLMELTTIVTPDKSGTTVYEVWTLTSKHENTTPSPGS